VSQGNYCGPCGAPLASTCGEAETYTCGGKSNQIATAEFCSAQINAADQETTFCWLFTDCFQSSCNGGFFDLAAAVAAGDAVCNGVTITGTRRKRAGTSVEDTFKADLAALLEIPISTISFVRVVANNGNDVVLSYALVANDIVSDVVALAQLLKTDPVVKQKLRGAQFFVAQSFAEFVVQVEAVTPPPVRAIGDPHLAGAHNIEFDVFGEPGANYSLLTTPSFAVNMQLADRGPAMRYMTSMSLLYRDSVFVITPDTIARNSTALVAHFAALGIKVKVDHTIKQVQIAICQHHVLVFTSHTTVFGHLEFVNLEVRVPGCHDAYGGLLGQTYQCKYADQTFEWTRAQEDAFRLPSLSTVSGSFSPTATCVHEDEYRGEAIHGGSLASHTAKVAFAMTRR
jgi:hypothetical protein